MTSGTFESLPIGSIWVDRETRQRRELAGVDELAASIKQVGLINPPVVTRDYELKAGERRWTACKALGWTSIPVQFTDEIDPLQLHLIELEENVKRIDLPWQDECNAVAEYHRLRKEVDPSWSMEETGEALSVTRPVVSKKIAVAEAIAAGNKRVIEADKFSTAVGIVQRETQRKRDTFRSDIGAMEAGRDPSEEPEEVEEEGPQISPVPLRNEDFHEFAATYDGPKFNLIHCDFPYGVNADRHAQGQAKAQGGYADSADIYWSLVSSLQLSMSNVVAESAHLMFWFSMDYYTETKKALEEMGWRINPFPLIWFKSDNTGILPDPSRGPRRIYETAFFGSIGDRLIVRSKSNVFAHPGKDKSIHMSEKPRPMLRHFMEMFCDEHSYMLDPTCGSGNSVRVAEDLGARRVLGLERDEEFFNRAREAFYNDAEV